jgi:hypothetical protein
MWLAQRNHWGLESSAEVLAAVLALDHHLHALEDHGHAAVVVVAAWVAVMWAASCEKGS